MTRLAVVRTNLAGRGVRTAEERRQHLRELAERAEDEDPRMLAVLVGALSDLTLTTDERRTAWGELVDAAGDLTALGSGDLDPRDVAPHAQPSMRSTVADEVCQERITQALSTLVREPARSAVCPEPMCDGEAHYTGVRDCGTNEDIEAGPCPRWADRGSVGVAVLHASCVVGALLWLALIAAGQYAMCALHDGALAYCDPAPTSTTEVS